jgi:exosortase
MSDEANSNREEKALDALITGALHAWLPKKDVSETKVTQFLSTKAQLSDGEETALRAIRFDSGAHSPELVPRRGSVLTMWFLALLPCAYLWFRLMHNLSVEWGTNPQYSYGYLVPFLCLGLLARRWQSAPKPVTLSQPPSLLPGVCALILCCVAFLDLPTRLIEGSTPEWRLIQWLLGVEAVGLTLCMIYLVLGGRWLAYLAFPVCFFLVAVPWPTPVEQPIIQGLTRASGNVVVEVMGILGVPALQHGNVIEISTGTVGINEACSGIRSFQTSFMISLFFGEFYRLNRWRRLLLVPIALFASMTCNVGRMSLLTLIAAKKGTAAIAQYHDPAGISITVICTGMMWGVALLLHQRMAKARKTASEKSSVPVETGNPPATTARSGARPLFLNRISLAMILWFALVEISVQAWYTHLESGLTPGPAWTIVFPKDNPTLKAFPIDDVTRQMLRYDVGREAEWVNPDGTHWHTFYCEWDPGRVAGYLAKRHTPEICLAATGQKQIEGPELMVTEVNGITLPIRRYIFRTEAGRLTYVYHCRWEAGATPESYALNESARFNLVRGIWAGRGKHGQKVLEVFVAGYDDKEVAKQAFLKELAGLVKTESQPGTVSVTQK